MPWPSPSAALRANRPWSGCDPGAQRKYAGDAVNGYVESGYIVALASLGAYGASLVARQRAARRRLPVAPEAERVEESRATGGPEQ